MTRTQAPSQDPPSYTQRRLFRTLLLTVLALAAILIVVDAADAQPRNISVRERFVVGSQVDRVLSDFAEANNTAAACTFYDDFDAVHLLTSTNQGFSYEVEEFYNGSVAPETTKRDCAVDVGQEGQVIVAAFPRPFNDTVSTKILTVAWSLDGGSSWQREEAAFNKTGPNGTTGNDTAVRGHDVLILDEDSWVVSTFEENLSVNDPMVHVYTTHDGGSTWDDNELDHGGTGGFLGVNVPAMCTWDGSTIFAFTPDNNGDRTSANQGRPNLFQSTDNGTTWTKKKELGDATNDHHDGDAACVFTSNVRVVYITGDSFGSAVNGYRTTNLFDDLTEFQVDSSATYDSISLTTNDTAHFQVLHEGRFIETTDFFSTFRGVNVVDKTVGVSDRMVKIGGEDFYLIMHKNSTTSGFDSWIEEPPPPGVKATLSTFGNGQAVRTTWGDPTTIYVRDIQGNDRIYKVSPSLNVDTSPQVCNENVESDDGGFLVWLFHTLTDLELTDPPGTAAGLEVSRNTTFNTIHTCDITLKKLGGDVEEGGTVLRRGDTLKFVNYNTSGVEQNPIRYDAVDSNNFTFGLDGGNPGAGGGNWGFLSDANTAFVSGDLANDGQNQVLPRWENLTDVAVDQAIQKTTRLFCVTSASNGTGCWNQNGGQIAVNNSLTADFMEVYQDQVYLYEDGTLTKYDVSTSGFTQVDNTTDFDAGSDMVLSKDATYIIGCVSNRIEIFFRDDLTEEVTTETFSGSLRSCDVDAANNYAYAVDSTTLYKLELFNSTTNVDEDGNPIGVQNPTQAFDTQSTSGTNDTTDGDTTTPSGSSVTDLTGPADALGISESDFAVFMSVLAIVILGGGSFIISAQLTGGTGSTLMGTLGAFAGAGLAVTYGWMPDWLLFLLVLFLGAFMVAKGKL